MQTNFEIELYGKWILSGEHAVLRGHPAIIFPIKSKTLNLFYQSNTQKLHAEFSGDYADEMQFVFWSAVERASEILQFDLSNLHGNIHLKNNIPVGAGMGASGALCVAVGRLLMYLGYLAHNYSLRCDEQATFTDNEKQNLYQFAKHLEDLFHNQSSGADIAVAIAQQGIYFTKDKEVQPIQLNWQPLWYLSFCGKASITAKAVKKVKNLFITDVQLAEKIDTEMAQSVLMAQQALQMSAPQGLPLLAKALNLAHQCYQNWDLCDTIVEQHTQHLLEAGALAVKPTGAGDGGYVISLWEQPPPDELAWQLLRI